MRKLAWLAGFIACVLGSWSLAQPPLPPAPQFVMAPNKLPDKQVQEATMALLAAIEAEDFANFVRIGTDELKADYSKERFARLVQIAGARMEKSYTVVYFGELQKAPYTIHMWKLAFRDGGRDLLGETSIRNNQVAGFHIH